MKAPAKSRLHFGEVAIAAVAVCLRWGSYFAALANHDLPQWAAAFDPAVSGIGDGEMARINIEASAALSDWIDLLQPLPGVGRHQFRQRQALPDGGPCAGLRV